VTSTEPRRLRSEKWTNLSNEIYNPKIQVDNGTAEIEIEVNEKYFHSAGAVHGSVYFKMLDDAAFFAVSSLEKKVFVLTTSFTTYITKPVSKGIMRAQGKVVNQNKTQFIAEAVVFDAEGNELGRGNGIFVKSKIPLGTAIEYKGA
jgi:uncharacterized protein (TIGR00369 family)